MICWYKIRWGSEVLKYIEYKCRYLWLVIAENVNATGVNSYRYDSVAVGKQLFDRGPSLYLALEHHTPTHNIMTQCLETGSAIGRTHP